VTTAHAHPNAGVFLARNGGGGLFTRTINQRVGSYLCVPAFRLGLAPTVLTGTNLLLGLAGSAVLVAAGPSSAGWALLLWQLAYSFDCADGQLARVTGRASAAGARVDVLCDAAVQISLVVAVSSVVASESPGTPDWLAPAFAGVWIANMLAPQSFTRGRAEGSLFGQDETPLARAAGLLVDYGAVVTVLGVVLAVEPAWAVELVRAFVTVHCVLLAVRIAVAGSASVGRR
jgi:phosphatidylglycerophosphate synthase